MKSTHLFPYRKRFRKPFFFRKRFRKKHIHSGNILFVRFEDMKHVTIKDVASQSGVSISTVSRAFNDKYDIHPNTRDRILAIAKAIGYKPNPIARKLINQKSYNIGIVVPEFENAFFPRVIIGAQELLQEHGFQVLIMQSNEDWEKERKNVETLVDNMVDGLIISQSSEEQNLDYYQQLLKDGMPIVFFNRVAENLEASKVLFDDYKWALFATEHLILQGHQNIIHFAAKQQLSFAKNRKRGFINAHKKHKRPIGQIIPCGSTIEEGEEIMERLINEKNVPDAIFSANDFSAIGAMKALKKHHFKVPSDVALVGFSESKAANYVDPPLTSVSQPTELIGQSAAELLISQIQSEGIHVHQKIILNGHLNIKESSMKI